MDFSFDVKDWTHVSKSLEEARLIEAQRVLNDTGSIPDTLLADRTGDAALDEDMEHDKPEDYQSSEDGDEGSLGSQDEMESDDDESRGKDDEHGQTAHTGIKARQTCL